MSQANNRGGGNKRSRISSSGAYRQRENQSSSSSTNVAQTQSGLIIDNETELSSEGIKEQLNSVDDIITQPIIEVPTKRLLHLKELGGNLFVSSTTKIYSKILQKLFDRVLFTKSLNNDVNTAPSDLRVFERVLARSDDNDAYSTCTSLAQPIPATILVLGSTSSEHALVWKLSQRRNFKIFITPGNSGTTIDQSQATISNIFQNEKEILDFVDSKQIDLVISLNKTFYYEELEARLCERGLHYLGCSVDTLALSDDQLNAKQFMTKHKIPTLDWTHCFNQDEAEKCLNQSPNQHQWIVRATNGNGLIHCRNHDETLQTIKAVFQDHIFGKLNQSIILEHGYSIDDNQVCILYIVSDGDGDYTQLPIIQSDPLRMGAYGPCPYLTSKQLSFIRRRIVERTLRCSPTIRHLFGFRLLIKGINYNEICLLDYISTFDEPEAEILFSLCEPDIYLQYALDLPSVPILSLTNKKRRLHCVNTTITSTKNSLAIPNKVLVTATKNNKVKIFHNQTDVNVNNNNGTGEPSNITSNGERIFNVLGYGSTLQEAQIQSVLACEYIKQHANIENILFKSDIGSQAIEWYKTHVDRQHSSIGFLNIGKKNKTKKKKSITINANKRGRVIGTRRRNPKNSEQDENDENESTDNDDDDDDENEPMDFERAFGTISDTPKLEHMDIYQNNGNFDDLNIHEGEFYFDLTNKIDLKTYTQPVLISSTINLNPLAAVRNYLIERKKKILVFSYLI
jgi:phosphoribosylamine-glycine ligase